MKFLNCLICKSELEIVASIGYNKIIKCTACNYQSELPKKQEPEVFIIKK